MLFFKEIPPLAAVLYQAGLTVVGRVSVLVLKDQEGKEYFIAKRGARWYTLSPEINGKVPEEIARAAYLKTLDPIGKAFETRSMHPLRVWLQRRRVRRAMQAYGFLPPKDPHEEPHGEVIKIP